MGPIKQEAIDYALKRFMRPDAYRYLRPDWRRFWPAGQQNDALYRFYEDAERKYRPDQARVPAGVPEGGQWTEEGGAGALVEAILAKAKRVSAAGGASYQRCLDLCYPILERFSRPGSDRNTFDFHKCMNACLGKNR